MSAASDLKKLLAGIPEAAAFLDRTGKVLALNDLAYISSKRVAQIPPALVTAVRDEKEQKDYLKVASMPVCFTIPPL